MSKLAIAKLVPVLCLGLVIVQAMTFHDTVANFKYAFGDKSATISEEEKLLMESIKANQQVLEESTGSKMFVSREEVIKKLKTLPNIVLVSEKGLSLVSGVWTPSEEDPEAVEVILKATGVAEVMVGLNSLGLYYESLEVSEVDNSVKLVIRLTEVKV